MKTPCLCSSTNHENSASYTTWRVSILHHLRSPRSHRLSSLIAIGHVAELKRRAGFSAESLTSSNAKWAKMAKQQHSRYWSSTNTGHTAMPADFALTYASRDYFYARITTRAVDFAPSTRSPSINDYRLYGIHTITAAADKSGNIDDSTLLIVKKAPVAHQNAAY